MANDNSNLTLQVYARSNTGKNASYRARRESLVPAIVYGPKLEKAIPVSLKPNDVRKVFKQAGRTALVTLESTEGAPSSLNGTKILFKDIQSHPYKNELLHVDLHSLDLSRKLRVTVPLQFVGKAKGLAEGGIMSIVTRQVEIKCLPTEIPSQIEVDVSELAVNDSIHIDELAKKSSGKNYEFIYDNDYALVAVVPPEEEKAADPAAAAAATATDGAAAPAAGAAAPAGGAAKAAAPAADKAKK